jgi:hypothetical protein
MAPGQQLSDPWKRWWEFLGEEGSWREDATKRSRIHARLLRFSSAHWDQAAWVDAVVSALARGKALVEAAGRWADPAVGQRSASSITETDRFRGDQWRLVVAYGGFQTVVKALMGVQRGIRLEPALVDRFIERARPIAYSGLSSPQVRDADLEDVFRAPLTDITHPLLVFLDLSWSSTRTLYRWLVEGRPVETWTRAMRLARALRDATAHGALSASRAKQWQLRPGLRALTEHIGQLVAAALAELMRD